MRGWKCSGDDAPCSWLQLNRKAPGEADRGGPDTVAGERQGEAEVPTEPSKDVASGRSRAEADALFESLYDDLRRMARREVWRNGARGFVGTRTLVHEVWLDIRGRTAIEFDEPRQFLAYAAQTMRGLVIDRVRAAQAQKRGGGLDITSLDT